MRELLQTVEWSRRNSFPRPLPAPKFYSPRLRRDQVKAVYYLKRFKGRPMTKLVQEPVDRPRTARRGRRADRARAGGLRRARR